jgi:hypothetical protein
MASTAVTAAPRRDAVRYPVLLLPIAVGAGLAIGWLGVHEHVSGARIVVDLALAWSLVAASLVALERLRWRPTVWLLAAAAFARHDAPDRDDPPPDACRADRTLVGDGSVAVRAVDVPISLLR